MSGSSAGNCGGVRLGLQRVQVEAQVMDFSVWGRRLKSLRVEWGCSGSQNLSKPFTPSSELLPGGIPETWEQKTGVQPFSYSS